MRWFNFGVGGEGGRPVSHPGEVWMRESLNTSEPWCKVKILRTSQVSEAKAPYVGQVQPVSSHNFDCLSGKKRKHLA